MATKLSRSSLEQQKLYSYARGLATPSLFQMSAGAGINVGFPTSEKMIAVFNRFGPAKLTIHA
jgi:hypothetical protein